MPEHDEAREAARRRQQTRRARDGRGEKADDGELGELAGLQGLAGDVEPAPGAADLHADARARERGRTRRRRRRRAGRRTVATRRSRRARGPIMATTPTPAKASWRRSRYELDPYVKYACARRGAVRHDEAVEQEQDGRQDEDAALDLTRGLGRGGARLALPRRTAGADALPRRSARGGRAPLARAALAGAALVRALALVAAPARRAAALGRAPLRGAPFGGRAPLGARPPFRRRVDPRRRLQLLDRAFAPRALTSDQPLACSSLTSLRKCSPRSS